MKGSALSTLLIGLSTLWGCVPPKPPAATSSIMQSPASDPLGSRPPLGPPKSFEAPAITEYTTSSKSRVWLQSRSALPIVSIAVSVPFGSASDPPSKAGLQYISTAMLDEGAGNRSALQLSEALDDLGAQISASTTLDGSRIQLTVLKRHLPQAFEIFADILSRPHFSADEYKRLSELWRNALKRRRDNARSVARLVSRAVLYGPDTPYGHPTMGTEASAELISLEDVKTQYAATWRPEHAQFVASGDIDRATLDALMTQHLAEWGRRPASSMPPARTTPIEALPATERPKLIFVERAGAPQSVVRLVGKGIEASSPVAAALDLANTALGGSFTSRLNQNLREDRGWTYGAASAFTEARYGGSFVANTAVFSKVTAQAIEQMLLEIRGVHDKGLTSDELKKGKARDQTELLQTQETIQRQVARLTTLSMLGLRHDADILASQVRQSVKLEQVNRLAGTYLDPSSLSIIVVGPADVLPQLKALNRGPIARWNVQGRPQSDP